MSHEMPETSSPNKPLKEFLEASRAFQEETLFSDGDESLPSLKSYLSKRILEKTTLGTKEAPLSQENQSLPQLFPQFNPGKAIDENALKGNHLNSLDTKLTAGLEQYLPTPVIRLRIIKDRLGEEIARLSEHLSNYPPLESAPSDIAQKIEALQGRLAILKAHEKQVHEELSSLFYETSWVFQVTDALESIWERLSKQWRKYHQSMGLETVLRKLDPERFEMSQLNQKLQSIQEVLSVQWVSAAPSNQELSLLVNQYDQTILQLEALAKALRSRQSLRERWSESIRNFSRKFYT